MQAGDKRAQTRSSDESRGFGDADRDRVKSCSF
jgi:hypothetical protein